MCPCVIRMCGVPPVRCKTLVTNLLHTLAGRRAFAWPGTLFYSMWQAMLTWFCSALCNRQMHKEIALVKREMSYRDAV
jgi:hypothetical protein